MKKSPIAPLFETDAYKTQHIYMSEPGTEYVYSNFTPRGSRLEGVDHVVAFGLQAYIQEHIMDAFEDFFAADEDTVIELYEKRITHIMGPNTLDSGHIRKLHRKGYLPLEFKAVKEGTLIPMLVPMLTVENTDPEFAWLTNYIETSLSRIWFSATNATKGVYMRRLLEAWAEKTGGDKEFIDWQWHDFGSRGMQSSEAGQISASAHLLTFLGTDSLNAFEWIDYFYPGDNGFIGGSVPASEHSTMMSRGKDKEFETYKALLDTYPTGVLSLVSDTWSLFSVVTDILPRLHEQIVNRKGKLVIRPDSGTPNLIIVGTNPVFGAGITPEEKGLAELLWEQFGGTTVNGFKHLAPVIGMIYGDSISPEMADKIFDGLAKKGFSSDNIVYGAGSWFAIGNTSRDTFNFAIKATQITVNGVRKDTKKDPVTANGSKTSAIGRLAVLKNDEDKLYLVQQATPEQEAASELKTVWRDGQWVRKQSFADVRATLKEEAEQVLGGF